jgi:hypothetical protein
MLTVNGLLVHYSENAQITSSFFHAYQLHKIISTYADYFNQQRPHQGINQHIPARLTEPKPAPNYQLRGKVVSTPVLKGLFHSYSYVH